MSLPKIAIIIGQTRESRFADKPAQWILEQAQARDDFEAELVDLRDFDLPLFNEVASNAWVPSSDAHAVAWQKKIAEFDGYLFVTAEYNRSITGALKNALDQAYVEWARKPAAVFGYGSLGAARAAEHLRNIAVELQMVPVRNGIHLGGTEFFKVHPLGGQNADMSEVAPVLAGSVTATFDDLVWWANATKAAKA
ncbi:NADPH-dependent FMN reductase [Ketogulonicigenium vulgare]|nr:NAD(P)H-dependent oxidoreductase [Ketogulonicigenium vulgare]